MEEIRLQKYMAEAGVASRRKCEELIKEGYVSVNGRTVTDMGVKVSDSDVLEVKGRRMCRDKNKIYIMLHKPPGYITTVRDQFSRPSVIDLIDDKGHRVFPVGRLDYDTSGLLLLTNDGQLAHELTHPSHETEKVYVAEVKGVPAEREMNLIRRGIRIEEYITAPAKIKIVEEQKIGNFINAVVEIKIHEGKNRQIRKMCEAIGHPVIKLKRISVGMLRLGELPEGKWRYLSDEEVKSLRYKQNLARQAAKE
ncbi:ribosomal large subunit pseudouridine synthase B [Anaerobacterium chartisolvens]|uniref:Pseudouridine synthase n=1 Tax=Anaerobacterium chartisolvens TaxID=1297424 RepID=A0A369BEI4_9FIRM|nr:pseudouridine synthase [Anaerobacterium chartisolvens]RCX19952.1 ribosomal large subunit pseudouridine synthase B [Anaerobacterium chartisolvens]